MKKKISGTKFFADPNLSGWFNLVMLYQPKQKSYASTGIFQIKSFIFPRPLQARGITKSNTMSNATGRAAVGQPAVNRRSAIGQPPLFLFNEMWRLEFFIPFAGYDFVSVDVDYLMEKNVFSFFKRENERKHIPVQVVIL